MSPVYNYITFSTDDARHARDEKSGQNVLDYTILKKDHLRDMGVDGSILL
jgi:hypothetical protein